MKIFALTLIAVGIIGIDSQAQTKMMENNVNYSAAQGIKIPVICSIQPLDDDMNRAGIAMLSTDRVIYATRQTEELAQKEE